MIDLIPAESYSHIYYVLMGGFIVSFALLLIGHPKAVVAHPGVRNKVVQFWGWSCVILLLLLLGLRPISYAFGDMGNYYKQFLAYEGGAGLKNGDLGFEVGMWLYARYLNAPLFFLTCFALYLLPLVVAFRRFLGSYWPLAFFLAAAHFDFYGYGVNGIRQGVASSLFLLALSIGGIRAWMIIALSVGIHGSLVVPAAAYAMTYVFRKPAYYYLGWLLCLLVTAISPKPGEMILGLGFADDRYGKYLDAGDYFVEQFAKVGFRFDFLAYSLPPIFLGFYLVIVRKVRDDLYIRLLSVYLTANAVWLLMIRTAVSNRVAYLSWCLMGLLIAYPLVKHKLFKQQHVVYIAVLVLMFGYTFVRNI